MRPNKQDGCLPHQLPAYILDLDTGEELDETFVNKTYVMPLLEYVRDKTKQLIASDEQRILKILDEENKVKQPTGIAWRHGIRPDLDDAKKSNIMEISRIEKIIQSRVVSELQSYVNNPNPKKEKPTFEALRASLGAADKQIATVEYDFDLNKAMLVWKCWTRELLFIFNLPDFVSDYKISKFCLPTVRYDKTRERVEYDFPFVEALDYSENEYHHCYGAYDDGRKEPYRLAFKNHKGGLIAEYRASGRCRELNLKRERLLADIQAIQKKLAQFDALGISEDDSKRIRLTEEKKFLKAKAKAEGESLARLIGWEISQHCSRHKAAAIAAENLSWVNDAHGSSRWNHSRRQFWVERECQRIGTAFLTVSAKNSSQMCCHCGSKDIVHNTENRTIKCRSCNSIEDRDVSAARILAVRCANRYRKYMLKVALSKIRSRC